MALTASALPNEPANEEDRECDRPIDELDGTLDMIGLMPGRVDLGVISSKGADCGPGDEGARPMVLISFG